MNHPPTVSIVLWALLASLFFLPLQTVDAATFVRGDTDGDGELSLPDPVRTLGYLFLRDPLILDCSDAADGNDDGFLDISDAVYVLRHLFLEKVTISAPYPECGEDLTEDGLGCVSSPACDTTGGTIEIVEGKERNLSLEVEEGDLDAVVAGNAAFALDLYQEIRENDGNIFYSPHSISVALAMTYVGARNATAEQMAGTLHYTLAEERLHPAFNALDLELASRGENLEGEEGDGFQLTVANSIWGERDYTFLTDFVDVLGEHYGSGMRLVDFIGSPEPSRLAINGWVGDQTENRIKDLLPQGIITAFTRLVLTNAIFFKASWLTPFEESLTQDRPFHLLDGSQVDVATMTQDTTFGYALGNGYQAVELAYFGEEISMVVIMPDSNRFEEIEALIDALFVQGVFAALSSQRTQLYMPKFDFEFTLPLKGILQGMGMEHAFSSLDADFSGMDGTDRLFIHDVLHKGFIAINEAGTEAAAATAVVVGVDSMPPEIRLDRPFLFLIRDIPTGTVLFVGRVVDPTG